MEIRCYEDAHSRCLLPKRFFSPVILEVALSSRQGGKGPFDNFSRALPLAINPTIAVLMMASEASMRAAVEALGQIQLDDGGSRTFRSRNAVIGRAGPDIDDRVGADINRLQGGKQPLAFVSSDENDAQASRWFDGLRGHGAVPGQPEGLMGILSNAVPNPASQRSHEITTISARKISVATPSCRKKESRSRHCPKPRPR